MENDKLITIALIEDHEGLRISLQNFLEYSNFKVVLQKANGREAIDALESIEQLPQICILDINMPVMDGYQTAGLLSEKYPEIRVLVFTSLDNRKSIEEMLGLGVRGYIVKGSPPEKLKEAAVKLCQGGYFFSETVRSTALTYLAEKRNFQ